MTRTGSTHTLTRSSASSIAILLAVALLAGAGCGRLMGPRVAPVNPPTTPAGIVGQIRSIDRAQQGDAWGAILVEGGEQTQGAVSDKAMVTITEKTLITTENRWIPPEDLTVGMTVRVWFTGPVAESYPVQGSAEFIEVP